MREALKKANAAIENLWLALEEGKSAEMITERIHKREAEKQELEKQLAVEVKSRADLNIR